MAKYYCSHCGYFDIEDPDYPESPTSEPCPSCSQLSRPVEYLTESDKENINEFNLDGSPNE